MTIYFQRADGISPQEAFGVKILTSSLKIKGVPVYEERISKYSAASSDEDAAVVRLQSEKERTLQPEGYSIRRVGRTVHLLGADPTGAMYGLMEIAEKSQHCGWDEISDCDGSPFLKMRGVKFNLPHNAYAEGEIFEKNRKIVEDKDFWLDFIDFLAKNRYNCLSLWTENPFEVMIRLDKYPLATKLSDSELEKSKELYKFIFRHAKMRGIETYIITWNLRISNDIAKGLGLPAEIGSMNHDRKSIKLRQQQEIIKDYFREAVKTLVLTYPELTGIGTSNSEELDGSARQREQWVADTYLAALKELNCSIPFIHRTNMSSGSIAQDMFLSQYECDKKYVSWKYSNAHMYSHPLPAFEELFGAWGSQDMSKVKVIYTVRNDDFHNLRGCSPDFLAAYFKGMKKPYVEGFYWGADGYLWAGEFQHVKHKHVNWKYSFEKHWMQFEMIGRLSYDPSLESDIWIRKFTSLYGGKAGPAVFSGLCAGVNMLCAVNRLIWLDYDFQWHPETLLSKKGFRSILDFMDSEAMPGTGCISIKGSVSGKLSGERLEGENLEDILELLDKELGVLDRCVRIVKNAGKARGELECVFLDMQAWAALGGYYRLKFKAAAALLTYAETREQNLKSEAVVYLEQALCLWKELSLIGASHYLPYRMARVDQTFGWGYYIDEVEEDITRALEFQPR
ncbi:MAG: glycoside hydrolase family 20 zincin-like fold domain-containing protein [Clostridiales bacterium]|jgi:hypothetical protein|nr:glycoside hydrolase family 20 zincin-like fold domain-containing protein [Clostridiales bacterium]